MFIALLLLSAPATARPSEILPPVQSLTTINTDFVPSSHLPSYDTDVLVPLHAAQAARKAADEALAIKSADDARLAEEAAKAAQLALVARDVQPPQAETPPSDTTGTLSGTLGYALPYGNCVLEAGVNNPGWGNPIDWPLLTQTPSIGATALFYFNHVAVVSGIWSNGDIEVRHQNVTGGVHRYPRSMIRGFR